MTVPCCAAWIFFWIPQGWHSVANRSVIKDRFRNLFFSRLHYVMYKPRDKEETRLLPFGKWNFISGLKSSIFKHSNMCTLPDTLIGVLEQYCKRRKSASLTTSTEVQNSQEHNCYFSGLQKAGFPNLQTETLQWEFDMPRNYKLILISPGKKNLNTIWKI